jgi:type VI secretion system protein ImpL
MKKWLVLAAGIIAILILCVIIWWVFPLIAIAGVAPFESIWLRLFLIVLTLAIFVGWHAVKFYRNAQAAKDIEQTLTAADPQQSSDAGVLAEKMTDAIQTLKSSSKSKGNFLYELPWYVIIGPPGAGKTTALLNSGLKFPLLGASGKAPISGTGGTRYCDWWFTEDAVFIDTAGRYTTQDSDADADRISWMSFLDLLKKNRPRQPINGVMVAIGINDIAQGNAQELASHAQAIRRRLAELHERLQVDFPVYILFTKADLVAGFMEFFGHLDEVKRKAVWGATFQTADKKQNKVTEVGGEIDVLVDRLLTEVPDRLQEEADPLSRVKLFGLPSQLAALKPAITDFLMQVFEPTRYQQNAALRGFYFTSGTQEGTPIDKVLGSMTGAFGARSGVSAAYSGREKSFFLGDLLSKVIFGEAGWVSTNAKAVRRSRLMRIAGYGAIGLATLATLGGWFASYTSNSGTIADTNTALSNYESAAAQVIAETPIGDTDFQKILPHLNAVRTLPAGFDNRDYDPALLETLGLNQRERLQISATASYRDALDRMLRSRLVLHMENRLTDLQDKPELLYEPLKVYMMLGGDPNIPIDSALIKGWMQSDWDGLFPGEPNKEVRAQLQQHLDAMLELNPGTRQIVALNGDLVKGSQKALLRLSLAERAFALLKSTSRGSEVKDWSLANVAGADASAVFEAADGASLDAVRVPAIFTYDGFYTLFLNRMKAVMALMERERWLLGEDGQKSGVDQQFSTLGPDLFALYDKEFLNSWAATLGRIRMKSLSSGSPDFPTLAAASGVNSPIKLVMESIAAETRLTEAKKTLAGDAADKLKAAGDKLKAGADAALGNMAEIGLDAAKKSEGRGGDVQPAAAPGAVIQERFRRYHELATGKGDKNQLDVLVGQLKGLHQSLIDEQNPELQETARPNTLKFISALASSASRLEAPFSTLLKSSVGEFEKKIVEERVKVVGGQLAGSVSRKCIDVTSKRYPFSPKSKQDVPIGEFADLLGPNGAFDQFFREKLAGLVDTSAKTWSWKSNTKLGQGLSDATLKQFQNAARIRDAFFTGQGSAPNVRFALTMVSMSQQTPSATFEVNGTPLESPFGVESRGDFEWPGSSPDGSASLTLPEAAGSPSALKFTGPWALHRLINAGSIKQSGNKTILRYVVGGREVVYQLTLDTLDNPFVLLAQLKFTCPTELGDN